MRKEFIAPEINTAKLIPSESVMAFGSVLLSGEKTKVNILKDNSVNVNPDMWRGIDDGWL